MQTSDIQVKNKEKRKKNGTTIDFMAWKAQTMIESKNVDVLNQE